MTTNLHQSDIRALNDAEIEHVAGGNLAAAMAAAVEGGTLNGGGSDTKSESDTKTCKETKTSDGLIRVFTAAGMGQCLK